MQLRLRLVIVAAALLSVWAVRRPPIPGNHPDAAAPAAGQPLAAGLLFHQRLDLARATYADLLALPGMGPTKARAVLEKRKRDGQLKDLRGIPGLGPKTLRKVAPFVETEEPEN